MYTVGKS